MLRTQTASADLRLGVPFGESRARAQIEMEAWAMELAGFSFDAWVPSMRFAVVLHLDMAPHAMFLLGRDQASCEELRAGISTAPCHERLRARTWR